MISDRAVTTVAKFAFGRIGKDRCKDGCIFWGTDLDGYVKFMRYWNNVKQGKKMLRLVEEFYYTKYVPLKNRETQL